MRKEKALNYLGKWWVMLILFVAVGAIALLIFLNCRQTYTAQTVISYCSGSAEGGENPDGTDVDPEEIRSTSVISEALKKVNTDLSVDEVRNSITVKKIIPEEKQKVIDGAAQKGVEFEYYPTDYQVFCELPTKDCYVILQAVVDSYFRFYKENHVSLPTLPAIVSADYSSSDYFTRLQTLNEHSSEMILYLSDFEDKDTYRSGTSGYTMSDLNKEYSALRRNEIFAAFGEVLKGGITGDSKQLMDELNYTILENNKQIAVLEGYNTKLLNIIQNYSAKVKDATVQYQIELVERAEGSARGTNTTTYESLFNNYMNNKSKIENLKANNTFYRNIKAAYKGGTQTADTKVIDQQLESIKTKMEELDATVSAFIDEYSDVKCAELIQQKNIGSVTAKYNIPLYFALGVLWLILLGLAILWLIGRVQMTYSETNQNDEIEENTKPGRKKEKAKKTAKAPKKKVFGGINWGGLGFGRRRVAPGFATDSGVSGSPT